MCEVFNSGCSHHARSVRMCALRGQEAASPPIACTNLTPPAGCSPLRLTRMAKLVQRPRVPGHSAFPTVANPAGLIAYPRAFDIHFDPRPIRDDTSETPHAAYLYIYGPPAFAPPAHSVFPSSSPARPVLSYFFLLRVQYHSGTRVFPSIR